MFKRPMYYEIAFHGWSDFVFTIT